MKKIDYTRQEVELLEELLRLDTFKLYLDSTKKLTKTKEKWINKRMESIRNELEERQFHRFIERSLSD